MMVFKRNQIVILSLILVILVAGYLQYSYKRGASSEAKQAGRIGEAVYVQNQSLSDSDNVSDSKEVANLNENKSTEASKTSDSKLKSSETVKTESDYFAQAKLDKELSRSKSADSLKAIADDANATKEARAEANEQRIKLIQNAEKEARIETLIEKSFDDAIVMFADDGSIDIVVKAPSLTVSQTTQIADIASRQAKVDIADIHVRKYN